MIKVDIGNIVPVRAFAYLAAFIPGLFFIISLSLANPDLIRNLVDQEQSIYDFGGSTLVAIGLVIAFVIGTGFILWVRLIQRLFGYLYFLRTILWTLFCKWPVLPVLRWLTGKPFWNKRRWVHLLLHSIHRKAIVFDPRLKEVQTCWHGAAAELLKKGYGIDREGTERFDWGVWYSVLGKPSAADLRGSILMIAFHATGWCGIVALHYAPALKNAYFGGFLSLLIFCGISHDWFVAKSLNNPLRSGLLRIRAVLTELRQLTPRRRTIGKSAENNDDLSISQDDD